MVYLRKHLRKGNAYYSVVETFRENKRVRQRILHYIGSEEDYNHFLQGAMGAKDFLSSDLENLLYQTPISFWNLIDEIGIKKILETKLAKKEFGVEAATAACAMVLNYATDRQSKCRFSDWYSQTYLPHILKIPASKMNKDLLCRTMDQFTEENIYDIHAEIFKTANELYHFSDDYLFYDTSAVTFEGRECDIAERGYNAAYSHNPQINIGLATTKERFPVMHKVFDGSTKDVSTLVKIMPLLEKTGNIEKTVFIVDRGIHSKDNFNLVRSKKAKFIFGKPKDKKVSSKIISPLKEDDFVQLDKEDKDMLFYETTQVSIYENEEVTDRLLIFWSKELQADNKKTREKRINKIDEKLAKLAKNVDEYTKQEIYEKLGVICKDHRKFFDIKFNEKKLTYKIKPDQVDLANKTEGRYAILTNTDLSPKEVLSHYRDRNFVEMSFKDLKLFINVGPVRHWKDERVISHVFLAILAMGLRSVFELKLRRAGLKITSEEALIQLNRIRSLVCKGKVLKITGQTEDTQVIIDVLEK